MPISAINMYIKHLPARQAELRLLLSEAVSVPHMKEFDRKNALRSWERVANAHQAERVRPATPAQLNAMGIGVQYVSAKPG